MKPISPGLSKPVDPDAHRWPSLERRGIWTKLEGWDADEYDALRHTLVNYDTHGDLMAAQILWLYHSGLNLPMKNLNDMKLLVECIQNHADSMKEIYKDHPKVWVKPFTAESVAACYQQQLERVLGVTA